MSEPSVSVREWTDVVRRARLGRTVKAVAFALATYADYTDGRRVRPGLARLAVDCELRYNTVQDAVAALRDAGLIQLVRTAARRGDADEYRLALAEDVLERIEVLSPAAQKVAAERLMEAKRGRYRKSETAETENLHPAAQGAELADAAHLHPAARDAEMAPAPRNAGCSTPEPAEPAPRGATAETRPAPRFTGDLHPAPRATTTQEHLTKANPQPSADPRTAVTGPRASPAGQDHDPTVGDDPPDPLPAQCAHGFRVRLRKDGTPSCALCRREPATGSPLAIASNVVPFRSPRGAIA